MRRAQSEQPTLDEMLDEPMVRLVMASDGVTRAEVESLFRNLRSMQRDDGVIFRLSAERSLPEAGSVKDAADATETSFVH